MAPKERRPPARAVPFHGVWTGCRRLGAARERVGSARAGPRPQRERAQWRACALHAQVTSRGEREGWQVGARAWRRRNSGLLLVQYPCISEWSECRQRGTARARRKCTCWASSQERASAVARKRATRSKPSGAVRGRAGTWEHRRGPEGTAASRSCSALPRCEEQVPPARRGARASEAPVLDLVPRESERSGAQARYTRKPPRAVRGRAGTWEHGLAP